MFKSIDFLPWSKYELLRSLYFVSENGGEIWIMNFYKQSNMDFQQVI